MTPLHQLTQNARLHRQNHADIRGSFACSATQQRQIGYWIECTIGVVWSCDDLYSMNRCAVTSIASENAAVSEAQAT